VDRIQRCPGPSPALGERRLHQEQQEYERREEELARDPDQGGKSTEGSPGADFKDGNGQDWDVKGFQARPGKGGYTRDVAEKSMERELRAGENVALDMGKLSRDDFDDLKDLVASTPKWADKVVIYGWVRR
jgi:hypothetical protein